MSTVQRVLIEVSPETGRYRQIRRHFHHVSHHLLGDTSHGRGDHNRLIRQHYGVHRLLLHAWRIHFAHPVSGEPMQLEAPLDDAYVGLLDRFGWTLPEDMGAFANDPPPPPRSP